MSETRAQYARTRPEFDPVEHTYTLHGKRLYGVTQILKAVLPVEYIGATEWHMERGHVVHQCAAMLCRGQQFWNDPQIDGQVRAIKAWLDMRKPDVVSVERMVWRETPVPYAGTLDLLCRMQGRLWIVDWKGSASPWDQWQLGGYADALADDGESPTHGLTVEVKQNGRPKEGKPVKLRSARNEWRSILNVFNMMKREGILK